MIQLIEKDGNLYYPAGSYNSFTSVERPQEPMILLCIYDAGDCDSIEWPNPNRENLLRCLFGDRECGIIGDEEVLLPDGTSAWGEKS